MVTIGASASGSDTVLAFAANVRMTGMSTGDGDVDYNVGNCNVMVPSSLQPPPCPSPCPPSPGFSSGSRQMQVSVIHERLLHYFLTAHLPQRIIQPEAALSWSLIVPTAYTTPDPMDLLIAAIATPCEFVCGLVSC